MTVQKEQLINVIPVYVYGGSNAQDIVDDLDPGIVSQLSLVINSETGGTVVFGYDSAGPQTATADTGDFVAFDGASVSVRPAANDGVSFVKVSDLQ